MKATYFVRSVVARGVDITRIRIVYNNNEGFNQEYTDAVNEAIQSFDVSTHKDTFRDRYGFMENSLIGRSQVLRVSMSSGWFGKVVVTISSEGIY